MPSFRLETVIAAPVADCFDLSRSVDAHTASMGPSGERAVAGISSGPMALGDTVAWQARPVGFPGGRRGQGRRLRGWLRAVRSLPRR